MELTLEEAANMLGTTEEHVQKLIDRNELKAQSLDGQLRIDKNVLVEFIQIEDKQREEAFRQMIEHTEEMGGYQT